MGRSSFFGVFLVLVILVLGSSYEINRQVMATVEFESSLVPTQETEGNSREMIQEMDYNLKPGPNTNPRTGYANPPPPQG